MWIYFDLKSFDIFFLSTQRRPWRSWKLCEVDFFIWMLSLPLMTPHIEWAKRYLQIFEITSPPSLSVNHLTRAESHRLRRHASSSVRWMDCVQYTINRWLTERFRECRLSDIVLSAGQGPGQAREITVSSSFRPWSTSVSDVGMWTWQ